MSSVIESKLWRLTKVLYFLITIPFVIIGVGLLITEAVQIARGVDHNWYNNYISDYYLWSVYAIILIIWYLLLTDFIRRIISYIDNWSFSWVFDYVKIIKEKITYIIWLFLIICWLLFWSYQLNNQCTGSNEYFDQYWFCVCREWYVRSENWKCIETFETKVSKLLPVDSLLREIKQIPNKSDVYIGIYIQNYKLLNWETDKDYPYSSCPEQVIWKWIEWDYHVFTVKDNIITSDIIVPLEFRDNYTSNVKLTLSYVNTKENNFNFFNWQKPVNEIDWKKMERSTLMNFKDLNGDWKALEFWLIDAWDSVCWHNNHLIVWYDEDTQKAIIYPILRDWKSFYWADNFIPNSSWIVVNWREYWDHWAEISSQTKYKYSSSNKRFEFVSKKEDKCPLY